MVVAVYTAEKDVVEETRKIVSKALHRTIKVIHLYSKAPCEARTLVS